MRRYKTERRSLRPWHFSLPDRLRDLQVRYVPHVHESVGRPAYVMRVYWSHSFYRRRPIKRRLHDRNG